MVCCICFASVVSVYGFGSRGLVFGVAVAPTNQNPRTGSQGSRIKSQKPIPKSGKGEPWELPVGGFLSKFKPNQRFGGFLYGSLSQFTFGRLHTYGGSLVNPSRRAKRAGEDVRFACPKAKSLGGPFLFGDCPLGICFFGTLPLGNMSSVDLPLPN